MKALNTSLIFFFFVTLFSCTDKQSVLNDQLIGKWRDTDSIGIFVIDTILPIAKFSSSIFTFKDNGSYDIVEKNLISLTSFRSFPSIPGNWKFNDDDTKIIFDFDIIFPGETRHSQDTWEINTFTDKLLGITVLDFYGNKRMDKMYEKIE